VSTEKCTDSDLRKPGQGEKLLLRSKKDFQIRTEEPGRRNIQKDRI
jgi:hypothetical protein